MEDLIPLFIIILITIVGVIGRKRRKSRIQEEQITRQPQRKTDDLLNWLDQLNTEEEEEVYLNDKPTFWDQPVADEVEIVQHAPSPVKEVFIPGKFQNYSGIITEEEKKKIMAIEGIPAITDRGKINTEVTGKEEKTASEEAVQMPGKVFDLKKAVVYSSILNRKYT